jgi:hypothetical protein
MDRIERSSFDRWGFILLASREVTLLLRHEPSGEVISVPAHRPLKVGTLSSILKDVQELTGLGRDELLKQIQ